MKKTFSWRSLGTALGAIATLSALATSSLVAAEPVVPGSGYVVPQVGDDFEDPNWTYYYNSPKASVWNDKQARLPGGGSANRRWLEPTYRGQPDVVKRVPTPEGGIPGSEGSMLIRTMHSGVPGDPSGKREQDDLLCPFRSRIGSYAPVSWKPSCVVRVYMPPFEEWEPSSGSSFAFRAACRAESIKEPGTKEEYWPGIFVQFESPRDRRIQAPRAYLIIRSDKYGRDVRGPEITQLGWWTLGMSFTPDGMVHYYAHPGVEDLTADDYIASHLPYGMRNERLEQFFFNVCSVDNGRSWSTPWIIDDPLLFTMTPPPPVTVSRPRTQTRQQPTRQQATRPQPTRR